MKRTILIPLVLLALAACSGGGQDLVESAPTTTTGTMEAEQGPPACSEAFAPGTPTDEVVAGLDTGCTQDGGILWPVAISWTCPDGRTVTSTSGQLGWGFAGETWNGAEVPEPNGDCS